MKLQPILNKITFGTDYRSLVLIGSLLDPDYIRIRCDTEMSEGEYTTELPISELKRLRDWLNTLEFVE